MDSFSNEPQFQLRYFITLDDFYEYLHYVDKATVPARKEDAKRRFYFHLSICAAFALFILLMPGTEKLIALSSIPLALIALVVLWNARRRAEGNGKVIDKLKEKAVQDKGNFKDPMELALYEDKIHLTTEEGMRHIRYSDIDWIEDSENLHIVGLRRDWDCLSRDIERLLIPKRAVEEELWQEMKKFLTKQKLAQDEKRKKKKKR